MTRMSVMRTRVIWTQTERFILSDRVNFFQTKDHVMPSVNDGRRLTGPESSLPYSVFASQQSRSQKKREGRGEDELRKIFLSTGVMSKAQGSAYIEQGRTKVMVGVWGPREVQRRSDFSMSGSLTAEFKFAPFSRRSERDSVRGEEEELGLVVSEALASTVCLDKYPKSVLEVGVTVLEDDGSVLAAALTGAGLALASAGVHMSDLVVGVKLGLAGDSLLVDPEAGEEREVEGEVVVGVLPGLDQVVACVSQGLLSPAQLSSALAAATQHAATVLPAVQQELVTIFQRKKLKDNQK